MSEDQGTRAMLPGDGTRTVAMLIALVGLAVALVIYASFGTIEIPQRFGRPDKVTNWGAVTVAISVAVQSLFWSFLLSKVASILDWTKEARDAAVGAEPKSEVG